MSSRLLGVVLCGGRSSRMGQDKAALSHPSGGTFISHAIGRLSGLCEHVVVSGGRADAVQAEVLEDPKSFQGPVVGIVTALRFASEHAYDACMITPVDMPLLTTEDLSRLRSDWEKELKLCCALTEQDQRLQPLVAIYPTSLLSALQELADSADRSLTRWIKKEEPRSVNISVRSGRNINTLSDSLHGYR